MNSKNQHIDEQLLAAMLEGSASDLEKQKFQEWINTDPENKKIYEKMQKIWKSSKKIEVFQKIDVIADWRLVKAKAKKTKKVVLPRLYLQYAASILVLLSVGFVYLYQTTPGFGKYTQLKTIQQKEQVVLTDGSLVFLNKNSKLIYSNQFNTKIRNVTLEGEAYFQVQPDPSKPFIIKSGNAIIEVLGTSFNVRNESDGKTIVTVNSGKVSLKNQESQEVVYLTKGEKGVLFDTVVTESLNDEQNFDAWKTGILRFNHTPILLVFKYIENYYGVKISNKSTRLDTLTFSSVFNNASIDEVIQELELHLRVKTVKQGNHLIISDKKK